MTTAEFATGARKFRAPRETHQRLIVPEPWTAGRLLQSNRMDRETSDVRIGDLTLHDLSSAARTELVHAARAYTCQYRDINSAATESPQTSIVLSGHQPELFHPGVWFKTFLLDRLATDQSALAIQLIIDNDLLQRAAIRVPGGELHAPTITHVPFDEDNLPLPYEERPVRDRALLDSFDRRVMEVLHSLVPDPLVPNLWKHVRRASGAGTKPLGQVLAEGRHRYEEELGLNTLEVPWSSVCDTRSFYRFVIHLLRDLPAFHALYNEAVLDYRRQHRLRSQSHPVPLLRREGDWWETPLWIWSSADPVRQSLWIRLTPRTWELRGARPAETDQAGLTERIEHRAVDIEDVIDQFDALRNRGTKIRTRALITTMYARTILGDLFLHGIGGSVYDQLTDVFISRFLGLQPPSFFTVSATVLLPVPRPNVDEDDLRQLNGLLRDLWYHPEQHLEWASTDEVPWSTIGRWVEQKHQWIDREIPPEQARQRHLALEQINANLRATLESTRTQLLAERDALRHQLQVRERLGSREFAFCLFPQEMLVGALRRLSDDL